MAATQTARRAAQWLKAAKHPPLYVIATLITSIAGFVNGYDTGTIGPVTTMPSFISTFGELPPAVHGIVVSCLLVAATCGSLFAGPLSDNLGRPRAVSLGSLVFGIGAALEASSFHIGMFIAGRCIAGFGEGLFLSTLAVYVCEISPPTYRGTLAALPQIFCCIGLCIGFFTCYGSIRIQSSMSWRLPLAIQSAIGLAHAITGTLYLPQSPRWLAYKGRREEAARVWDKLGVLAAEREKDSLVEIQTVALNESAVDLAETAEVGPVERLRRRMVASIRIFRKGTRKPLLLGIFLSGMQQLSGIDGVLYYAPILFQQAGLSSTKASFFASGVSAILILVFSLVALVFVDKWGRRSSTIYGGLLLFACMATIGSLYATNKVHATYGAGKWVVIVAIYVFAICYAMTWAIGVKVFTSEIQPIATRATATSLAMAANCITNFFVAFITPVLLSKSSSLAYFLFGGCVIFTVAVCVLFMPETRGRDLEAISDAFDFISEAPMLRALNKVASTIGTAFKKNNTQRSRAADTTHPEIELQSR